MWRARPRRAGHRRCVPGARHPDYRRQREPVQRDRRPARFCRPGSGSGGTREDASRVVGRPFPCSVHLQADRDPAAIILLGENGGELGGSEYSTRCTVCWPVCRPRSILAAERRLQQFLVGSAAGLRAPRDCAEVALPSHWRSAASTPAAWEPRLTCRLQQPIMGWLQKPHCFGESASRVIVSVEESRAADVLARAVAAGVPAALIGRTGGASRDAGGR